MCSLCVRKYSKYSTAQQQQHIHPATCPYAASTLISQRPAANSTNTNCLPLASLQTHPFCSRCGQETVPTEGGSRRRCIGRQPHKLYPRTDPVVRCALQRGSRADAQQQQLCLQWGLICCFTPVVTNSCEYSQCAPSNPCNARFSTSFVISSTLVERGAGGLRCWHGLIGDDDYNSLSSCLYAGHHACGVA